MRISVPFMAATLLLGGLVAASQSSAEIEPATDDETMTIEEMRKEARTINILPGSQSLGAFVPMVWFGTTGVPLREFCYSDGMLRHTDESKAEKYTKKGLEQNAFPIPVILSTKSSTGEHIYLYVRMVELPTCK